ncbi:alcohol dehydrogenase catalytic domain-containing protein [Mycobacterium sp. 1274756.6]|uniref:alcohol dehydrogenase catalytic domain-containing protein n=1 Tax=Mycobacterium sp. 1274756.6 TaxID=1834076 RepID=UPI0007FDE803|nr:alcohol dehydrogenase catalytic domain-containing protein [Mycobacterium sp. 1274756.6]OBJ71969.1 glutathione-dependent formaldehyde dehydrogenase [Mycobacterium sp. 1274756.6]
MRAVTWQGTRSVEVNTVADPVIEEPTDAIIEVTTTNICGSDLHLYEVLGPFMGVGDIMGHEPIGVVCDVGREVTNLAVGDRVVIPFQISCGHCAMCRDRLTTQCETTQVHRYGTGAALFGYSKLYGQIPGAQAQYLRVPQAQHTHIKVPEDPPDSRYVYLSDVLPTAWQAVQYAAIPPGGSVTVLGLGPIGDMCARIASHLGHRVIGVDLVADRLARAAARGVETIGAGAQTDVAAAVRELTGGRGSDAVIDAVGMEAHGSGAARAVQRLTALMPRRLAQPMIQNAGIDRLAALYTAIDTVRRGGTISLIGVYGGKLDPVPLFTLFDKQIQLRMGQANVKPWVDDILPLLTDDDPLGVDSFATHELPLEDAAHGYRIFQEKRDGAVKVLLKP